MGDRVHCDPCNMAFKMEDIHRDSAGNTRTTKEEGCSERSHEVLMVPESQTMWLVPTQNV